MNSAQIRRTSLVLCLAGSVLAGCEKGGEPSATPAPGTTTAPAAKPAGQPAPAAAHPSVTAPGQQDTATGPASGTVELSGLTMTVPEGWQETSLSGGMFAASEAKAYTIPGTAGDAEGCTVKVTHFPMMKGKDDININRWLAQVMQADGKPTTREQATVTVTDLGHVRLTVVDATGSLNQGMGMGAGGTNQSGQRLIAAIVDHPQGPHFVKATGTVESMKQAEASIDAFLKSAKTK